MLERFEDGGGAGRRNVGAAAALLAATALVWFAPQLDDVGVTWDEPAYFESVERIQAWTDRALTGAGGSMFDRSTIQEMWNWAPYLNPHPPVYKEMMAATEALAGSWIGTVAGYRIAPLLAFAGLIAVVVLVAGRRWGLAAGVGAGFAVLLQPRLVGHAHIGATDTPLALFWVVATLGAAGWLRWDSRPWGIVGTVALGMALGTKFTGWLLPIPVAAWALVYCRDRVAWGRLAIWLAGGLIVAYLLNPLAWHDPAGYVAGFVQESLSRDESIPIATYYLGKAYGFEVPWHHPVVMTFAVTPLAVLVLAGWGAAGRIRRLRQSWLVSLCLVQIAFFWGLLALPSSPNHDGVRLFLPMFSFLGLLAGHGFGRVAGWVQKRVEAGRVGRASVKGAVVLVGFVLFYGPYLQTTAASPYYLSYYGELIGGVRGGVERGMEPTYWLDALTPAFVESVNARLSPGDRLGVERPYVSHLRFLQRIGWLRDDVTVTVSPPVDYLLLYNRKSIATEFASRVRASRPPVLAATYGGASLSSLYRWTPEISALFREFGSSLSADGGAR